MRHVRKFGIAFYLLFSYLLVYLVQWTLYYLLIVAGKDIGYTILLKPVLAGLLLGAAPLVEARWNNAKIKPTACLAVPAIAIIVLIIEAASLTDQWNLADVQLYVIGFLLPMSFMPASTDRRNIVRRALLLAAIFCLAFAVQYVPVQMPTTPARIRNIGIQPNPYMLSLAAVAAIIGWVLPKPRLNIPRPVAGALAAILFVFFAACMSLFVMLPRTSPMPPFIRFSTFVMTDRWGSIQSLFYLYISLLFMLIRYALTRSTEVKNIEPAEIGGQAEVRVE